jgi:hypothetical protein
MNNLILLSAEEAVFKNTEPKLIPFSKLSISTLDERGTFDSFIAVGSQPSNILQRVAYYFVLKHPFLFSRGSTVPQSKFRIS